MAFKRPNLLQRRHLKIQSERQNRFEQAQRGDQAGRKNRGRRSNRRRKNLVNIHFTKTRRIGFGFGGNRRI